MEIKDLKCNHYWEKELNLIKEIDKLVILKALLEKEKTIKYLKNGD